MADLIVLEELQTYLIAALIGQLPATTPSTSVPSVWMQPRDGAPLPRVDKTTGVASENVTITLIDSQINVPHPLEAWIEETFVDVVVRARNPGPAKLTHRAIRELLHPTAAHGGRKQWLMSALMVEYSRIWRAEQPLPPPADGRNIATYDRVASYQFGCRRKALAGLSLP